MQSLIEKEIKTKILQQQRKRTVVSDSQVKDNLAENERNDNDIDNNEASGSISASIVSADTDRLTNTEPEYPKKNQKPKKVSIRTKHL